MKGHQVDVLVIGAGQAGLAVSYYLRKHQQNFVVIDQASEIGNVWRNRYDSLVLFTPRWYSSLLGLSLKGDPAGYATKDEIADYLQNYVQTFDIPVQLNTKVSLLQKTSVGFIAETNRGTFIANKVIIATGPFQKPFVPPQIADSLSNDVYQVHSSRYHNSRQLKEGSVLVVGAGNSGAQIAVELSKNQDVTISVSHKMKFLPIDFMGKSIFWWFQKVGILKATVDSSMGRMISRQSDPIFGKELKTFINQGKVHMKPRAIKAMDNWILFEDNSQLEVNNIIWATGFYTDYSWIGIPDVLSDNGKPIHKRGVSPVTNLFFLGLPWQNHRGSALIGGVGDDAKYLFEYLSLK